MLKFLQAFRDIIRRTGSHHSVQRRIWDRAMFVIRNLSAETKFVLRSVALVAIVLAAVISAIQFFSVRQSYSEQRANMDQMRTEFLKMISNDLASYNLISLEYDMSVLRQIDGFISIELTDRFDNLLYAIDAPLPAEDLLPETITTDLYSARGQYVGNAKLVLGTPSLKTLLQQSVLMALFIFALTFVPLAYLAYRFIRTYVTSPLSELREACGSFTPEGRHVSVQGQFHGQFGKFIQAFNKMQAEKNARDDHNKALVQTLNQQKRELGLLNQELSETAKARAEDARRRLIEAEALRNVLRETGSVLSIVGNDGRLQQACFGAPCPTEFSGLMTQGDFSIHHVREVLTEQNFEISTVAMHDCGPESDQSEADLGYDLTVSRGHAHHWIVSRVRINRDAEALILRDVTLLTNAELQLRQSQKMDALGVLASGVAHDFNNILTIIFGALENLKAGLDSDSDSDNDVDVAMAASERASAVVRQLLRYSATVEPDEHVISPSAKLYELEPLLRATLGPNIHTTIDSQTDCDVLCDPDLIDAAVINLATNAAYAMDGAGQIDIVLRDALPQEILEVHRLHGRATSERYVVLSLADTGCGVRADLVDRIFEPFFTTKSRGTGTGLGLSMVFGMCSRAGGAVLHEHNEPCGSRFKLVLPVASSDLTPRKIQMEVTERPLQGRSLLIIDDEDVILDVQSRLFANAGATVRTCATLEQFQTLVQQGDLRDIDFVLSDYTMCGWSGLTVARALEQHNANVDLFIVTGNAMMIDRDSMTYPYEIIEKPLSSLEIIQILGRADRRRTETTGFKISQMDIV
ncbi:hybrid sensor histidine kinase/response regulator [Palleronia caenipelagi]|uniref:histidine kinase n=1 Tax=Palleronia caenipelagi TaxID=2489174 RepID=A0A547PLL3_9RHOB|nr:ATP-binding protein [Palleronia caenipelagi]TRD15031.1 response regulator [Palleronia caenipelagi]